MVTVLEVANAVRGSGSRTSGQLNAEFKVVALDVSRGEDPCPGIRYFRRVDALLNIRQATAEIA